MHTGIDGGLKTTAIITLDDTGQPLYEYHFGADVQPIFVKIRKAHPSERYRMYHDYFNNYFLDHNIIGTIVMEAPMGRLYGNGRKILEINGIYLVCLSYHFPPNKIFMPNPTQIKKFFTTYGAATKEMMIEEANKRDFNTNNDHKADAYAMARMSYEGALNDSA